MGISPTLLLASNSIFSASQHKKAGDGRQVPFADRCRSPLSHRREEGPVSGLLTHNAAGFVQIAHCLSVGSHVDLHSDGGSSQNGAAGFLGGDLWRFRSSSSGWCLDFRFIYHMDYLEVRCVYLVN